MFCSQCGKRSLEDDAKYCSTCGKCLNSNQGVGNIAASSVSTSVNAESTGLHFGLNSAPLSLRNRNDRPMSFSDFRKRKEEKRRENFNPRGKKKARKEPIDVTINVGIMRYRDGKLTVTRGRQLPVRVSSNATTEVLLKASVEKHLKHDRTLTSTCDYTLIYPDGSEVKTMPGSQEPFVLSSYKDEIGKSYSRLSLNITTKTEFLLGEMPHIDDEDFSDQFASENEDENLMVPAFNFRPRRVETHQQLIDSPSASTSASSSAQDATNSHTQHRVQCPVCHQYFPLNVIEEHSENCGEEWIGVLSDEDFENASYNAEKDEIDVENVSEGSPANLRAVLQSLANEFFNEDVIRLNIRRKTLWKDFRDCHTRNKLSPSKQIKIVFMHEPAVDDGGPRREFFSGILEQIERNFFISGRPVSSMVALMNNDFEISGEVMVMSILQGGPAPCFLNESVFAFLAKKPLSPNAITVNKLKITAIKILEASDDDSVRDVLTSDEGLDVLQEIGYKGVASRETTKTVHSIVQSVCFKSILEPFMPQLMQLQSGLDSCGVLTSICTYPDLWKPLFIPSINSKMQAEDFLEEINVHYSASQLKKEKEIDIFKFFCDVVQSYDSEGSDLRVPELYRWITGSKSIPPLGLPKKIEIAFVHGCGDLCKCRPTTSTCDLLVKIPVHISSFEDMQDMMFSALRESHGFGKV